MFKINKVSLSRKHNDRFTENYLRSFYNKMSVIYSDPNIPYLNLGFKKETQIKFHYDKDSKSLNIIFEQSSRNVDKKFPSNFIDWDWFINLFFLPVIVKPYKNVKKWVGMHFGFFLSWRYLEKDFSAEIEKVMRENIVLKIDMFGWSHGGALVQLAYEYCKTIYGSNIEVHGLTIGAPRVFCDFLSIGVGTSRKNLKKLFSNLIMFAEYNDMFTHLPPTFTGFKHIVPQYKIGEKFSIKKIFKPDIYHYKGQYDADINKLGDNEV